MFKNVKNMFIKINGPGTSNYKSIQRLRTRVQQYDDTNI